MAAGWITFFVFSGFPVLLVTWLVASLRNPPSVEDIIMLNNDNGLLAFGRDNLVADFMQDAFNLPPLADEDDTNVDGTNTALVRQDTNRRSSSHISLTPSDIRLAMSIAYQDAARMFLQPSVSDPGINFDVETARFNSFRGAHPVIRCMSDCEVMYLGQRSVETPCDLLTNTTNLEYYRPPPRRFFSDPCINSFNAIDQYHYIDDDDIIVRIGSSYDLMSVAHRETKNRVEGPPTGKLATVLKHSREVPSEREGTDLDEAYEIHMAQTGGALEVSEEEHKLDEGLRQALKNLIADVDKEYGNNTTPVKEESSERDEGTDLDEAYKIQMAQNGGAQDAQLPEEEYKLDEGVRQALKNLIADVDKEYGNNTTPAKDKPSGRDEGTDLEKTYKIQRTQNGGAVEVADEDYELNGGVRQALKNLITDVDKEYGNNTTPVKEEPSGRDEGTDLDEAYKIQMAQNGGALDARLPEEEYKLDEGVRQALKNLIAEVDKEDVNNTTPVKEEPSGRDEVTNLEEAFKIDMAKNGGVVGVAQEDKDFQQALKDFLTDTDEIFDINRTPRRRVTNFLWQCQEVMFDVLRIYMDNRFY
ncbi:hypothetical protein HOLleu_17611 [Holothuria leucospilota]|uniref:Uncharacterized protein n=1 Tax=Holothuria leucospilota TaxID=206669 RepID=A0A9Q1C2F6_HOLLE|nr:hypothetical protein HOLleu_17611 [Holothuria leucospilota]